MAIELAYINTKHPDFHKDAAFVSSLLKDADVDHLKHSKRSASASNTIITNDTVSINFYLIFLVFEILFFLYVYDILILLYSEIVIF